MWSNRLTGFVLVLSQDFYSCSLLTGSRDGRQLPICDEPGENDEKIDSETPITARNVVREKSSVANTERTSSTTNPY
jgi:hypothetical protein